MRVVCESLIVAALILCGFDGASAQAPLQAPYAPATRVESLPQFAASIDSVSAAIGLPPLREVDLPQGYRELRIWDGFGIAGPFSFLRILVNGSSVSGEMFKWWDAPRSEEDPTTQGNREWMRRHWRCPGSAMKAGVEWCEVGVPSRFDWKRVLQQLESYRVWSLPDQQGVFGVDGFTLVVEARVGRGYRTYDYWITDDESPEEQDAAALDHIVFGTLDEEGAEQVDATTEQHVTWCSEETPETREYVLRVLQFADDEWSDRGRRRFSREELELIEEEPLCQSISRDMSPVVNPEEYARLHYAWAEGYMVFDVGKKSSIADGCVQVRFVNREFRELGGDTFCYR